MLGELELLPGISALGAPPSIGTSSASCPAPVATKGVDSRGSHFRGVLAAGLGWVGN